MYKDIKGINEVISVGEKEEEDKRRLEKGNQVLAATTKNKKKFTYLELNFDGISFGLAPFKWTYLTG